MHKDADEIGTAEIVWPGKRRRGRRRQARKPLGERKVLLASAMLVLLLLGAGTAVAGLVGRMDLAANPPLPWLVEDALTPSQPAAEEPAEDPDVAPEAVPEIPPPEAPLEESVETPAEAPVEEPSEPEPSVEDPQPSALLPVPNVDAYFDYFAVQTLENSGFRPKVVYGYREGYATSGVAWGTDPTVGTLLPLGSTITVYMTPKNQAQQPQPPLQPPPQVQPPPPQIQSPLPQVQQPPQIQPLPQLQPQVRG